MTRRVVVTGMAGLCPIGSDWKSVRDALVAGRSGVVRVPEWEEIAGLKTRLGARVPGFEVPADYPRKKTRSMGRVSLLMVRSAELALADAGLQGSPELASGRVGVSCGSSTGSPPGMDVYARQLFVGRTTSGIGGNEFLQFMSHTVAATSSGSVKPQAARSNRPPKPPRLGIAPGRAVARATGPIRSTSSAPRSMSTPASA